MSDNSADHDDGVARPTVSDVLFGLEPMGDLSRFVIDDLTPEDQDVFFGILDDA